MLCPGLTKQRVLRHLGKIKATVKGHMKHQCQNVRSTTKNENRAKPQKEEFKENNLIRSNIAFTKIHNLTEEIHTDLTRRFPIRSSANNQYVCIFMTMIATAS